MKYLNQINLVIMILGIVIGGYAILQTLFQPEATEAVTLPQVEMEFDTTQEIAPGIQAPAGSLRGGALPPETGALPETEPGPGGPQPALPGTSPQDPATTTIPGVPADSEAGAAAQGQEATGPGNRPAQPTFQPGTSRPVPPVQNPVSRRGEANKRQPDRNRPPVKGSLGERPPM